MQSPNGGPPEMAVPTIILKLQPDGTLQMGCNTANQILALGMLEKAKSLVQAPAPEKRPGLTLPPPGLDGNSLRQH